MKASICCLLFAVAGFWPAGAQPGPAKNPQRQMAQVVGDLLRQMTLEEKIGQLNLVAIGFEVTGPVVSQQVHAHIRAGRVGGVFNTYTPVAARKLQQLAVRQSRLGIPLLLGYDVIHGHRTIFPIPLGMAASWDMPLIEKSARIAAQEASADGLNWVFSPMVDIARDPRWGRIAEGAGEDAWYGAQVARAMVKGYQTDDLTQPDAVMACLKHFALYGAAEGGRDYNTVDMSPQRMFQDYLPPYQAAIEAGVGSVMSAFNEINGLPATSNKWLLQELLRKQWGFPGLVVSDYTGMNELVAHGSAANEQAAARQAFQAGNDMDMVGEVYLSQLGKLVEAGEIAMAQIDAACRRVLEAKYKLGLFQDPYREVSGKRAAQVLLHPDFLAAARDIARRSLVLLKNDQQTLPLSKQGSIALVGPLARNQRDLIGNWSGAGDWKMAVSVEQGIRQLAGNTLQIHYARGANLTDDAQLIERLNAHGGNLEHDPRPAADMIREAVAAARNAQVVVAVVGESQGMSGEAASRADISLPAPQQELLKALKQSGKPLVVVLMNGRPLTLTWESTHADALLETWFAGLQAGNAIAEVLFGHYNPAGKLTVTFPRHVGQIPLYYNHKNTGRPFGGQALEKYKSRYLDVPNEPLFPFGFGLSYTTFQYSKPVLNKTAMRPGETLQLKVNITNTGNFDGEEVVQLYLQDVVGSLTRPVKELKGYRKIALKKGETKLLTFTLTVEDMKFYNQDLQYIYEPGEFRVSVGPNSRDVQQIAFQLVEP